MMKTNFTGCITTSNGEKKFNNVQDYNAELLKVINSGVPYTATSTTKPYTGQDNKKCNGNCQCNGECKGECKGECQCNGECKDEHQCSKSIERYPGFRYKGDTSYIENMINDIDDIFYNNIEELEDKLRAFLDEVNFDQMSLEDMKTYHDGVIYILQQINDDRNKNDKAIESLESKIEKFENELTKLSQVEGVIYAYLNFYEELLASIEGDVKERFDNTKKRSRVIRR